MDTIGSRLRWARERRVLTQRQLAEQASVQEVTVSRIENGHYGPPKASTLQRLAAALEVDPAWLRFGDEEQEEKIAA